MNNASHAGLCALALLGASPALAKSSWDSTLASKIDAEVTAMAAQGHVNGLTLAIVEDGRIVYERAYGWRDVAAKLPVTLATKYEIGSITKQITAAAVLQLVDEGRVSLDATLSTYLPDAPHGREVTVRQLLSLTSGLPEYFPAPDHFDDLLKPISSSALIQRIADKPLNYTSGASWQHSNTNYLLLGRLIEKISGEKYKWYILRHVLSKAPAAKFGTMADEASLPEMSRGYANGKESRAMDDSWVGAAGNLVGNVGDLVAWDTALASGNVVSKTSFQAMTTRQTPLSDPVGFGFAFFIDGHSGQRRVWQDGSTLGFWGADQYYPERRIRVIVLTNDAKAGADAIATRVYDTVSSENRAASANEPPLNGIRYYRSDSTNTAGLAFSDAVRAGDVLYLNNQIGNVPGNGSLVEGGFKAQFAQIMLNIDGVLDSNRLSRANVVMCTVTVADMANWGELNRLWRASFPEEKLPARNVIGTTGLPLGAAIGVQCIAAYPPSTVAR